MLSESFGELVELLGTSVAECLISGQGSIFDFLDAVVVRGVGLDSRVVSEDELLITLVICEECVFVRIQRGPFSRFYVLHAGAVSAAHLLVDVNFFIDVEADCQRRRAVVRCLFFSESECLSVVNNSQYVLRAILKGKGRGVHTGLSFSICLNELSKSIYSSSDCFLAKIANVQAIITDADCESACDVTALRLDNITRGNGKASGEATDDDHKDPCGEQDGAIHDRKASVLAALEAAATESNEDGNDRKCDENVKDELP